MDDYDPFSNATPALSNATDWAPSTRHVSVGGQTLITFFYGLGVGANACALVLLSRGETPRNRKQTLMVRCLACNDLAALVGSFLLMHMQLYMDRGLVDSRWFCGMRVVLRTFGLSSGCVAVVMAAERWMALTRPFLYQKHVTHALIRRAIFSLWLGALVLVCLPFFGFGVYWEEEGAGPRCTRYRSGRKGADAAYALLMFCCGCLLCLVIVACNLAVVRALCRMGRKSAAVCGGRTTVRKDSRELSYNNATQEELRFAKLMVVLCVFFVACWVPQMMTILMAQLLPSSSSSPHPFYRVADVCMALNFTLDPVVYVLSRRAHRRGMRDILTRFICRPSPEGGSKQTIGANQHSGSNSSQKDCVLLEQMNKVNPKLRIIFATHKKSSASPTLPPQPTSKEDST